MKVIRNAIGNWKKCGRVKRILKKKQILEKSLRLVRRSGQLRKRWEALHIRINVPSTKGRIIKR
jgi:hypothetical protein